MKLEDRELQLLKKHFVGRSVAPAGVGLMGVDRVRSFDVIPLGEQIADITALVVRGKQPDGSFTAYDILAGAQPYAVPGVGSIQFQQASCTAKNTGDIQGDLWARIYDAGGTEFYNVALLAVNPGDVRGFPHIVVNINMPPSQYAINVSVGH